MLLSLFIFIQVLMPDTYPNNLTAAHLSTLLFGFERSFSLSNLSLVADPIRHTTFSFPSLIPKSPPTSPSFSPTLKPFGLNHTHKK
ncbi:hypothetical protein V6Z12_D05G315700 [Gossypium hirsutum]